MEEVKFNMVERDGDKIELVKGVDPQLVNKTVSESLLTLKYKKMLTVYVDVENDRKLIDYTAALSLGMVNLDDKSVSSQHYFVITDEEIAQLKKIGYEIKYIEWPRGLEYMLYIDDSKSNNNFDKYKDGKIK